MQLQGVHKGCGWMHDRRPSPPDGPVRPGPRGCGRPLLTGLYKQMEPLPGGGLGAATLPTQTCNPQGEGDVE